MTIIYLQGGDRVVDQSINLSMLLQFLLVANRGQSLTVLNAPLIHGSMISLMLQDIY